MCICGGLFKEGKRGCIEGAIEGWRIRTTSGGIVTIVSLLVVLFLAWGEWSDYRRVIIHPELVVDKGRGTLSLREACDEATGT